jgi:parallel beta-helix repeat protein
MIASRAIISALALWLAFSGVAAAEQLYVNESGWWRDGGAFNADGTPIQAAGDAIYVWNGSYNENVDVGKPRLTLEGEGADVVTVTAVDPGDHVFEVIVDWVNISGFAVRGATDSDAGVYLGNVNYCGISENNVYGNRYGIYLLVSNNNMLENNTASNNGNGVYLSSSSNNNFTSNTANSNNGCGIQLYSSSGNTLSNNTVNSNDEHGIYLSHSSSNILFNNTASSNKDIRGCGIYLDSSSGNMLSDNAASNNGRGINLLHSSNNTLQNNTANSNNWRGIYLSSSSNNTLQSNIANSNDYDGINLMTYSSNNTLRNNTMNSNGYYGICLYNADNNNITCNWVQNNTRRGFCLHSGSTGNTIEHNNVIENGNYNATSGGWEWQFYIDQYNPVEAKHNYWGAGINNITIDASIYDDDEGNWGEVVFYPFETEPVPCAPGPKRPAFTTTDAVIALEIAVGSRPPDLRWDVSGDGSVTSLDALMILQAADGGIEIG